MGSFPQCCFGVQSPPPALWWERSWVHAAWTPRPLSSPLSSATAQVWRPCREPGWPPTSRVSELVPDGRHSGAHELLHTQRHHTGRHARKAQAPDTPGRCERAR